MMPNLFIQNAFEPDRQLYFVSVIFTVVVSIILHELAHGVAALKQGDTTPRDSGHMTINPLIHMPPISIALLLLIGIAWGLMPVNPSRFRSRFGEAIVAVAGPLTNLALALLALTVLAVMIRILEPGMSFERAFFQVPPGDAELTIFQVNVMFFLAVFGMINIVLMLFNLVPLPPLDGSRILANFNPGYRSFIEDPEKQQMLMIGFFLVFIVAGRLLFPLARGIADGYVDWILSIGQPVVY